MARVFSAPQAKEIAAGKPANSVSLTTLTMKILSRSRLFLALLLTLCAAVTARAQLYITEAMSSSGGTGAMSLDWFEVTNFGGSAVNVTGYKVDDDTANFAVSIALNGITSIAPGESVIYFDANAPANITAFRTFWGGTAATAQIGNYSGSGIGLSSGGDAVNLYTGGGVLVDSVVFGSATSGVSFGYNTTTSTFGALSVVGQFGAFQSADALHNIGSPGTVGLVAVPEPGTTALLAGICALGVITVWRRRAKTARAAADRVG